MFVNDRGDNYWLNLKMDGGEDWQWSGQWVGDTWSNWGAGREYQYIINSEM